MKTCDYCGKELDSNHKVYEGLAFCDPVCYLRWVIYKRPEDNLEDDSSKKGGYEEYNV